MTVFNPANLSFVAPERNDASVVGFGRLLAYTDTGATRSQMSSTSYWNDNGADVGKYFAKGDLVRVTASNASFLLYIAAVTAQDSISFGFMVFDVNTF